MALILSDLGYIAMRLGNLNETEADFTRMTGIYRSTYGEQNHFTALALNNLASVYMKRAQYARAEQIIRDVIQIDSRALPAGHVDTAMAQIRLGRALVRQNRYREAEQYRLAGYQALTKQSISPYDFLQGARTDLIQIYKALQQPEKGSAFSKRVASW